jgi:hypothetical protein
MSDQSLAPHFVAASPTALVQRWMQDLLGARADQVVWGRLTWGGVVTAALFVVLALIAHSVAAWLMRRPARKPSPATAE